MSNTDSIRARTFMLLIYPDDVNYIRYLEKVCSYSDYAYINHDLDIVDDTGELKKLHTHVVLYFKDKKVLISLADEIGIPANYITVWDSKLKALRYLLHADNPFKAQYTTDKVIGTLKQVLVKNINNGYEVNVITEILQFIDDTPKCSYKALVKWVMAKGYYAEFRRSHGIIREYLK